MLNFIICDDETAITNTVKDIIVKTIFKTSIEYKIHVFHNYDDSFYEIIHSDLINKIYILDIEVNDKSGLEIAKEIRKRDWDSVIFILSAHYELEHLAFKSKVLIFDFISKFDLYDKRMKECILACINKVLNDEKLTVRVNRAITKIDYKDILYITYDSYRRKSVIMTTNDEYEVNEPLNAIYKRLIGDFKYTHRACITNMNNVVKIDPKERVIIFKNGQTTDLLSRNYKKEVKQDASN